MGPVLAGQSAGPVSVPSPVPSPVSTSPSGAGPSPSRLPPRPSSPPRRFRFISVDNAPSLPAEACEEERLAWYTPRNFYPARIGEQLTSQYQVIAKLGHGSYSTVWLCRDLVNHKYVSVKVNMSAAVVQPARELEACRIISQLRGEMSHPGLIHLTRLLDAFDVDSAAGCRHQCLVYEPLGFTFGQLRQLMPTRRFSPEILRCSLAYILHALDFLHSEAGLVHCDLQENNILVRLRNESTCLEAIEQAELGLAPSARKRVSNPHLDAVEGEPTFIYQSRSLVGSARAGVPVLCDFGEARVRRPDQPRHVDLIQPLIYRAPEVILGMEWDEKVDIWNLGVLIWDMFEKSILTTGRDSKGNESRAHHLAEIVSIIGPPPPDFVKSTVYRDCEPTPHTVIQPGRPRWKRTKSAIDGLFGTETECEGLGDSVVCPAKRAAAHTPEDPEPAPLAKIVEETQQCRKRRPLSPPGSVDDSSPVSKYFDDEGNWQLPEAAPLSGQTLEMLENRYSDALSIHAPMIDGHLDMEVEKTAATITARSLFLHMMGAMLTWKQDDRWSARELLDHPWMKLEDDGYL